METWTAFSVVFLVSMCLPLVRGSCRFDASANYTSLHPFSLMKNPEKLPPAQIRSVCYNDSVAVCWCTPTELDCSGNNGTLTFVPKVNGTFTFLNFTYNHMEEIDEDFFTNVTQITGLDLGDNHYLHYIHPRAFKPLTKLEKLFLDYDYKLTTNYSFLDPVFSVSTLTRLDIRVGDLKPLPEDLFIRHPLPRLEILYLHFNKLHHINMTTLRPLHRLRVLGAATNRISYVHADFAPSLEKLNLRYNIIGRYFPQTCRHHLSVYPKLKQLFLMDNKIKVFPRPVCLPSLTYLDLSGNEIKKISSGTFSVQFFPSLTDLYLQFMNKHLQVIQPRAFANPVLKTVSLLYNQLYFNQNISEESFHDCTGLENLLLGHNHISSGEFIKVFGHLKNLRYIHVGSNDMKEISQDTFAGFPKLETLCMYQNQLTDLPAGVFHSLNNLSTLEINDNQLQTVPSSAFAPGSTRSLTHLDLSQNPFQCDCEILWFQSWLLSDPSLFNNSRGRYRCKSGVPRMDLSNFTMAAQACIFQQETNVFIVVVVSILAIVLTLVAVYFRYRWRIRLMVYEVFRGRGDGWRRRQRAENFAYDVFVSYAKEDIAWVKSCLIPNLEGRQRLRLCIHQRDFIPGNYIVDNIFSSVKSSRKILMLFSHSFALSRWCQYELAVCLQHVLETDDALVVVCLHDLPSRVLTLTMMAVFHTTTYIQWEEEVEAEHAFWGRLNAALSELLPVCARN